MAHERPELNADTKGDQTNSGRFPAPTLGLGRDME